MDALEKAGLLDEFGRENILPAFDEALARTEAILEEKARKTV